MTRLSEANTSREIELSRYFRKRTDKRDLLVLVEGDDDIPFWILLFQDVIDKYARIDIETLKVEDNLTGNMKDRKGKDSLMEISDLGPSKVVAVDMDYDVVVPSYHSYSSRLWNDKYVLHTVFYSIENHKLFPDIVCKYAEAVLKESVSFDFENLIRIFSESVSPLLFLLIAYERKRAVPESHEQMNNDICIEMVFQEVASLLVRFGCEADDINTWQLNILNKYQPLFDKYRQDIEVVKDDLVSMGISVSECWKLLQGHTFANYLLRVLIAVSREQKRDNEKKIRGDVNICDKGAFIDAYHRSLSFVTNNLSDEIEYYFINKPFLSSQDYSIKLIRDQIRNL